MNLEIESKSKQTTFYANRGVVRRTGANGFSRTDITYGKGGISIIVNDRSVASRTRSFGHILVWRTGGINREGDISSFIQIERDVEGNLFSLFTPSESLGICRGEDFDLLLAQKLGHTDPRFQDLRKSSSVGPGVIKHIKEKIKNH